MAQVFQGSLLYATACRFLSVLFICLNFVSLGEMKRRDHLPDSWKLKKGEN